MTAKDLRVSTTQEVRTGVPAATMGWVAPAKWVRS